MDIVTVIIEKSELSTNLNMLKKNQFLSHTKFDGHRIVIV
ncbi:MAG: hypothetical protein PWQ37_1920 [Candidatus Petromonas sp.]|nr:hypothetical protein [Candidatus Petromonas sp.]